MTHQNLSGIEVQSLIREPRLGIEAPSRKRPPYALERLLALAHSIRSQVLRLFVKLLPKNDMARQSAQELARGVLLSPRLAKALVRTRPYLGLEIIREWTGSHERFDFIDLYLAELLRDSTSVFYQEIANNSNLRSTHRYLIPQSNRIIYFFLSDAASAHEMRVYKPVGDYALNYLDELARDSGSDPYNRAMGDFEESGRWNSPLYATIRFFDIMVEEALHQGIEWHMWLYYMPPMVKRVVRNYRLIDPLADPTAEWPTRYSFLLYEIFSALRYWIESVEDVPLDQRNVKLRSTNADYENGNIIKSSVLALCECARFVLESNNLTDRSKRDLTNMVFSEYFELRSNEKLEDYAAVLRNAISQGGRFRRAADAKYRAALVEAFEQEKNEYLITHREEHVAELEAALQ